MRRPQESHVTLTSLPYWKHLCLLVTSDHFQVWLQKKEFHNLFVHLSLSRWTSKQVLNIPLFSFCFGTNDAFLKAFCKPDQSLLHGLLWQMRTVVADTTYWSGPAADIESHSFHRATVVSQVRLWLSLLPRYGLASFLAFLLEEVSAPCCPETRHSVTSTY